MKTLSKSFVIGLVISLFPFYGMAENSATQDEGIVINGVRWATRNVSAPGTFTPNPENPGMLFQWNRKKGWNVITYIRGWEETSGWNYSPAEGTAWYSENDPCPPGWRVPTQEQLISLYDAENEWISNRNNTGIAGRTFGAYPNQIFLPALPFRNTFALLHLNHRVGFFYWSSTQFSAGTGAWHLNFNSTGSNVRYTASRVNGFSVRCVAK